MSSLVQSGEVGEPEITHKNTWITPVLVVDVLRAIHAFGFKASPYPIILSLEMHCSPRQQDVIAQHLIEIFGDHQLQLPPDDELAAELLALKSPEELREMVLVKGKRVGVPIALANEEGEQLDDDLLGSGIGGIATDGASELTEERLANAAGDTAALLEYREVRTSLLEYLYSREYAREGAEAQHLLLLYDELLVWRRNATRAPTRPPSCRQSLRYF